LTETAQTQSRALPKLKKKPWAVIAGLLVALAAGYFFISKSRSKPPTSRYQTAAVERGALISHVTATGTLSALVTVQVGSQVSGRIQNLYADFNSEVKKGQLIAALDPQLYQAALEQAKANNLAAQANVSKAKTQLVEAQRQFERTRTLFDQNLVSRAERDTAEANADAAKAAVEAAMAEVRQSKAGLNQAEVNLAFTKILSPINGIVISRTVDVGQTVAASLQAPTLFTIAEDLRRMQVHTSIAEADVGRLEVGMEGVFRVDAYPQLEFNGRVSQIRNAPTTVQNVVTYDAVIDVENPELKLKPGMTANVNIRVAEREDVLKVPNAALRYRPPAGEGQQRGGRAKAGAPGEKPLWLLRDGQPVQVMVTPGVTDGSFTEVSSPDLREGDRAITEATDASGEGSRNRTSRPPGSRRMF
jgi:HlyD family secretion protein